MIKSLFLVGVGGAAGSMCRYAVAQAVSRAGAAMFPLATFGVNLVGSFIIGVLFGMASRGNNWLVQGGGMLLLATGFCGGFTTFSSFALENVALMQKEHTPMALLYSVASVAGGLLLCRWGMTLTS